MQFINENIARMFACISPLYYEDHNIVLVQEVRHLSLADVLPSEIQSAIIKVTDLPDYFFEVMHGLNI